ncbi:MAG: hypothetical protein M0024_03565 [Nitrospiraceae bacterium]|nr:hypothetical protein [Nitrospiraceae bacterium]
MPIYEYGCSKCGKHHEIMQKITEKPLTACPDCGGLLKKKISNTSFVLKGTGWYVTDYAPDKKRGSEKQGKTTKSGDKKADGPAADTKGTETKTDAESSPKSTEKPAVSS